MQALKPAVRASRYAKLEEYLKAHQWKEADEETERLMLTAVGKEPGQWLEPDELRNFPCDELRAIDRLWVRYSQGHFGFSVQKQIYVECGGKLDGKYSRDETWETFGDRVGWRKEGDWNYDYDDLTKHISISSQQRKFPIRVLGGRRSWRVFCGDVLFSRTETCEL